MDGRTNVEAAPHVKVRRVGGNIGAEISGVNLGSMSDAEFAVIHEALVRHEVIVFRDQDITIEEQMDFGRRFGDLSIHPSRPISTTSAKSSCSIITRTTRRISPTSGTPTRRSGPRRLWAPSRAKVSPGDRRDTLFSMTAAYAGLSEPMKRYIHGMEALHDSPWRPLFTSSEAHQKKLREIEAKWPPQWHPVVRVHPLSGRRILNVQAQFCVKLKGLREDESDMILKFLYSRAAIPEYQMRVSWRPHTVVMWDNRAVQHYAVHDYYPSRRTMERVTVAGDPVVGVSGPYTAEENVGPLPDGKGAVIAPPGKRPIREFERGTY